MTKSRSAEYYKTVEKTISQAAASGVMHLTADNDEVDGRLIKLQGKDYLHFGSCSYLGLELDSRIKQGVIDTVNRYGSQFASSRVYISAKPYEELESLLYEIFHMPLTVAQTLTLGHQSNLPVLVNEDDIVIIDHQAHTSMAVACQFLKMRGIKVEMVRHNDMNKLEDRINSLKDQYRHIWYIADGVYSMYGDLAPMEDLTSLLDRYEQLHLYIDDAHGASCMGPKGGGYVFNSLPYHERMYLTISLAKSFSSAGGVLLYPNESTRNKVRASGNTMNFSGPIQPPLLGAAIASVKIHLTDELPHLQANLRDRVAFFNKVATEKGLELLYPSISPVCYIKAGLPETGYNVIKRLMKRGYFANLAVYPGVPYKQTGIRLAINNHLKFRDIANLIDCIAEELPLAIAESEVSSRRKAPGKVVSLS